MKKNPNESFCNRSTILVSSTSTIHPTTSTKLIQHLSYNSISCSACSSPEPCLMIANSFKVATHNGNKTSRCSSISAFNSASSLLVAKIFNSAHAFKTDNFTLL